MAEKIDLTGRVAIVTGAGGGLGREHALELARRGARVVVNDLGTSVKGEGRSSEAADKVVAEIKAAGGEAIANAGSVTEMAEVEAMVKQAIDTWGKVDILVANAGILRDQSFKKMAIEDFELVINVHLLGTARCVKAVWGAMNDAGYGRIIFTTSAAGLYGNFGQSNYGAAKAGLVGLMNNLKIEGAKNNVRVNTISPLAATRMSEAVLPADIAKIMHPSYVSPGVAFLASEDAPSGVTLNVGAGVFGVTLIVENPGITLPLDAMTAEAIASNWAKVNDRSTLNNYDNALDQSMAMIAVAKKGH
jgi:NAD(P)-dependent dehydrogenase (short-subunit alcohol dehydrogenase family)